LTHQNLEYRNFLKFRKENRTTLLTNIASDITGQQDNNMLHNQNKLNIYPLIYWVFFLAMATHLILFTWSVANPYIRSDGWFFISDFLQPFYSGNFHFSDLYTLRGNTDHAQPFHRLILLVNAKLFDLDFKYEAIFGSFFNILIAALLSLHFKKTHNSQLQNQPIKELIALITITILVFSLNSTVNYSWSLVTMAFFPLSINIMLFIAISNHINSNKTPGFLIASLTLLVLFAGDDAGILALLSASLILTLLWPITKNKNTWKYLAIIVVSMLFYELFKYNVVNILSESKANNSILKSLEYYLAHWDSLIQILSAPFADSLIHKRHLTSFTSYSDQISLALGLFLIVLHLFFWYSFFKHKLYQHSHIPAMLTLYSYALIAGIMIYRVPTFGYEYFHQPRYVLSYQIGLWGCILGLLSLHISKRPAPSLSKALFYLGTSAIIIIQILLVNIAWKSPPYLAIWQKEHAKNILFFSSERDKGKPCSKGKMSFPICKMHPEKRNSIIEFLEKERLNVFSSRIQKAYLKQQNMKYIN